MDQTKTLAQTLAAGDFDRCLTTLYGAEALAASQQRCQDTVAGFSSTFGRDPVALFSAPGRTELGGNHTDHQHGRVLAASVNLDILAAAAPNHSGLLRIQSDGFPLIVVNLQELTPRPEEEGTSTALVRGVAAGMAAQGCPLQGMGLDSYVVSNVPGGSGLSSSAAFEVLMGVMLNHFCWDNHASAVEIAQIGQYAENVFFGKPCGLMDQTASSVGGVVAIDFADPTAPAVEKIGLDLTAYGYALCILDSGAGHADLTAEYAAITNELRAVCQYFDKAVLRDVPKDSFWAALPQLRKLAGDRAILRAMHFYSENQRAAEQAQALQRGDFDRFLHLAQQSGQSSGLRLQNLVPACQSFCQELLLTIALCEEILGVQGAVRVHGGGFGGTAQAFVPLALLDEFRAHIETILGEGHCHVLSIRPVGGIRLYEDVV